MSINSLNPDKTPYPLGATSLVFSGKSNTGSYNYTAGLTAGDYIFSAISLNNTIYTGSYYMYNSSNGVKTTVLNGGNMYLQLSASDSNVAFRPSIALVNTFTTTNRQLRTISGQTISQQYPSFQTIPATGLVGAIDGGATTKFYKSTTSFSNWTLQTMPAVTYDFTYGAGVYVAVGVNSIYYSTDATTWTISLAFTSPANTLYGVRFVNNLFIAAGRGSAYSSTNGITWTTLFQGLPVQAGIVAATYFNNLHIAATNTANSLVYISTDNQIWNTASLAAAQGTGTGSVYSDTNEVLFGAAANTIHKSTNGTTWTTATTNFVTQTAVVSINKYDTTYVATAGNGQLSTSTDLTTWTARAAQFGTSIIYDTAFGNSAYVAVGAGGRLTSSTDLVTWTARTSQFGTSDIYSVAFGAGRFVAAGAGGRVSNSTDGITWTAATGTGTNGFNFLYWDGTYFNATASGSTFYFSTNGVTWGTAATGISGGVYAAYKAGTNNYMISFYSASNWLRSFSTNNITWNRWAEPLDNTFYSGINYTNGYYVLCGTANDQTLPSVITSTDLVNWTERFNNTSSNTGLRTIVKATNSNTIMLAGVHGGSPTAWLTSTDAVTYTSYTNTGGSIVRYAATGNGFFINVGDYSGTSASGQYSTNGTVWTNYFSTSATVPSAMYTGTGFMAMNAQTGLFFSGTNPGSWENGPFRDTSVYPPAFGGASIVAPNNSGQFYVSTNGSTFIDNRISKVATPSNISFYTVTYGNGKFVAASNTGSYTSTNGIAWTFNAYTFPSSPVSAAYSPAFGLYYVGAFNSGGNSLFFSTNGVSWTSTPPGSFSTTAFAIGPDRTVFVGGSNNGYVYYSTDTAGQNFTLTTVSGALVPFKVAAYGNGIYMVAGNSYLATSTTGAGFTLATSPFSTVENLIFSAGYFYFVASTTGQTYSSTNGVTWTLINTNANPKALVDATNTLYQFFAADASGDATISINQGTSSASIPTGYYLYQSNLGALV